MCPNDSVSVDTVALDGSSEWADRVQYSVDGAPKEAANCAVPWDGEGCRQWEFEPRAEGRYRIEAVRSSVVVGTTTLNVVFERKKVGECCDPSFRERVEIVVNPGA